MTRGRRRPPLGPVRVSRRWEVGMPLMIVGALTAGLTVGVRGADVLFWVGTGLLAVGAGVFFATPRRS